MVSMRKFLDALYLGCGWLAAVFLGGIGVIRALRVLDHDGRVSLQSDRRKFSPYGLHGGADGKRGRNFVIGLDGSEKAYPGKATLTLGSGEVVVVETPGGGGWGKV